MSAAPVAGRVSLLIPAYNSSRTIRAAIESCLAQTYADVEVIVVDDGSTDPNLPGALREFGDRIRVIRKPNGGVASARNAGIRAASGEFVAWMDDDDIVHPDRLRLEVKVLESFPDVQLVSTDFSAMTTDGIEIEPSHIASYYGSVARHGGVAAIYPEVRTLPGETTVVRTGRIYELLTQGGFVHPPTVMTRRGIYDEVGFLEESFSHSGDWEQIMRIARAGTVAYIDLPMLRYRRSPTQLSKPSDCRVPLETLQVIDMVAQRDPALYARHRAVFEAKIAENYIRAAHLLGPTEPRRALGLLARSLRHRWLPMPWLRALGKSLLPASVVAAVKPGPHAPTS